MHSRRVVLRFLVVVSMVVAGTAYMLTKEPVRGIDLHSRLLSSAPLPAEMTESCTLGFTSWIECQSGVTPRREGKSLRPSATSCCPSLLVVIQVTNVSAAFLTRDCALTARP